MGSHTLVAVVIGSWSLVAVIVVGYPLVAGRMRAGAEIVVRREEPQRFWTAYAISTLLFLGISAVAGLVIHRVLP